MPRARDIVAKGKWFKMLWPKQALLRLLITYLLVKGRNIYEDLPN